MLFLSGFEVYSRWVSLICICSVILGNLSLFEIIRASVLLPEKFRCNLTFYESENFSNSSLHSIF